MVGGGADSRGSLGCLHASCSGNWKRHKAQNIEWGTWGRGSRHFKVSVAPTRSSVSLHLRALVRVPRLPNSTRRLASDWQKQRSWRALGLVR